MLPHRGLAHRSALANLLRKRILLLVTKSPLCLLIVAFTSVSTPRVASAQDSYATVLDAAQTTWVTSDALGNYVDPGDGFSAAIDCNDTKWATSVALGNYVEPGGGYTLIAMGQSQVKLVSITVEFQVKVADVWTSWDPKQILTATTANNKWSAPGWNTIKGGSYYRTYAVMTYQYKNVPTDDWTTATAFAESQKFFP
jgi:hypothetical protein